MINYNHDPIAPILFWVTLILFCALVGRYVAQRCRQPAVVGEIIMGVLLGNLCYYFNWHLAIILREWPTMFAIMHKIFAGVTLTQAVHDNIPNAHYAREIVAVLSGPHALDWIRIGNVLEIFSRYGVILLLFMVGLDSSVEELRHTGSNAFRVAVIGVVTPLVLGFMVAYFLMPEATYKINLFVAATLTATSVSITARVLAEQRKMHTSEAKIILGAAILDDILGLIILAIVSSIIIKNIIDVGAILRIIVSAILFFIATVTIGPIVLRSIIKFFNIFLQSWQVKLYAAFIFAMLLAWCATAMDLVAIIGAFCAGLILNDDYFIKKGQRVRSIKSLVAPFEAILAPLFFILIGVQIKLEAFASWQVLAMALALIVVAILGKVLSGWGASFKEDRLLIGIGMLPRGEVGLIFASIGRGLGIMSDELFSAIILMVIVTTLLAPPLLKWRFSFKP